MKNAVRDKSFNFALRIIKLYTYLATEKKQYVLAKQILRCGTSIGANVEEALGGQSSKDFISKISIAYKEARETGYWLKLLKESGVITVKQFNSIFADCEELQKIISSILLTMKKKQEKQSSA